MKNQLIYLFTTVILLASCYKDKGNYEYSMPVEPQVTSLDSVYSVFVGDSLIIDPGVKGANGLQHLQFKWKISVPEKLGEDTFSGPQLRMIFGLGPKRYFARLTITDLTNDMKYFHDFVIAGKTAFSKGIVVLSEDINVAKLSFIKPDGEVQAGLYEAIHSTPLPGKPLQLIAVRQAYNPAVINSYWMFFGEGLEPGIQLDANTMQRIKFIRGNFFDPPATIRIGSFTSNFFGVITGVINNNLYAGTTSTWDQNPLYGMFGLPSPGDYELSDKFVFNFDPSTNAGYYIAFDKEKQQFLRFNLYGTPNFFGTAYDVIGDAFDPKKTEMELLHLTQINGNDVYAFMKSGDGTIYECKFGVNFNGPFQITVLHKREFKNQSLINGHEKIVATQSGIFYIASAEKLFRYNPLNQELMELASGMEGKSISMLKVVNQNTLIAGAEGAIYFLDISTGHYGEVVQKIGGLPGSPVDLEIRE